MDHFCLPGSGSGMLVRIHDLPEKAGAAMDILSWHCWKIYKKNDGAFSRTYASPPQVIANWRQNEKRANPLLFFHLFEFIMRWLSLLCAGWGEYVDGCVAVSATALQVHLHIGGWIRQPQTSQFTAPSGKNILPSTILLWPFRVSRCAAVQLDGLNVPGNIYW